MRQGVTRTANQPQKRQGPVWSDPTPELARKDAAPFAAFSIDPLPATQEVESRNCVMLIGDRFRTSRLQTRLEAWEGYGLRCIEADNVVDAERYIANGRVDAVLYVAPLEGGFTDLKVEEAVSTLSEHTPSQLDIVHLALVPEDFEPERVCVLYGTGIRAVFAWPKDISPLPSLVQQMLANQPASIANAVLARVRVHLQQLGRTISVDVTGDSARVTGRVESLWAKFSLERHARQTPGIKQVDISGVEVDPVTQSDTEIANRVRRVLDTSKTIKAKTLGVSVQNGNVILMGRSNPDESNQIIEQASIVPGVRWITEMTLPSESLRQRDCEMATTLEQDVADAAGAPGLRVAIVKHTVVLRGVGSSTQVQCALSRLRARIEANASLRRVIDRSQDLA